MLCRKVAAAPTVFCCFCRARNCICCCCCCCYYPAASAASATANATTKYTRYVSVEVVATVPAAVAVFPSPGCMDQPLRPVLLQGVPLAVGQAEVAQVQDVVPFFK